MNQKEIPSTSAGFVGLIALLVSLAIMAFFMAMVLSKVVAPGSSSQGTVSPVQESKNVAIESNMETLRQNALLYFVQSGSYLGLGQSSGYQNADSAIANAGSQDRVFHVTATAFCYCAPLQGAVYEQGRYVSGETFCIDSYGYKRKTSNGCERCSSSGGFCSDQ